MAGKVEMTSTPAWVSLVRTSLAKNKKYGPAVKYVQLATVRQDHSPAVRTVVFRDFLPKSSQLSFVTDSRSEKCAHLKDNPRAEVCWYFPQSREQWRFSGIMRIVDDENTYQLDKWYCKNRQTAWHNLTDQARSMYFDPAPGKEISTHPFEGNVTEEDFTRTSKPAPTFNLLCLEAVEVDHLHLRQNSRRVYYLEKSTGVWKEKGLNP